MNRAEGDFLKANLSHIPKLDQSVASYVDAVDTVGIVGVVGVCF